MRHYFSRMPLVWLFCGALFVSVAHARAPINQAGSEDRITQLERILNAQSEVLTQLQMQVNEQQRDIADLRDQVQQAHHQLQQRQQNAVMAAEQSTDAVTSPVSNEHVANVGLPTGVTPPFVFTGNENTDYNMAVSLALEKKQYEQAMVAFREFIQRYPDSTFQPNANYWLGQLNYNKGNKEDAASYFAYVVKNFPKSPKSSDAMLKVGMIMLDKGDKEKAKAVFQQVIKQYSSSDAAEQAQKYLATL